MKINKIFAGIVAGTVALATSHPPVTPLLIAAPHTHPAAVTKKAAAALRIAPLFRTFARLQHSLRPAAPYLYY